MSEVLLVRCDSNLQLGQIADWIPHWRLEGVSFISRRPRLVRSNGRIYLELQLSKLPALSPCAVLNVVDNLNLEEVSLREARIIPSIFQRMIDALTTMANTHLREQSDIAYIIRERYIDEQSQEPAEHDDHHFPLFAILRSGRPEALDLM